jgi:hypothetical protein
LCYGAGAMARRLAVLTMCIGAAGCLWRSYATILSVHLDVLTQTAAKLCSVVEARRGPTIEGMAEYIYPAQRGREFLRQFSSYSARRSYQQFSEYLDRYEAMVRDVDATRAQSGNWQALLPRLTAQRDALVQLAAQIRADLKTGN